VTDQGQAGGSPWDQLAVPLNDSKKTLIMHMVIITGSLLLVIADDMNEDKVSPVKNLQSDTTPA
jgi:hypothetical protein